MKHRLFFLFCFVFLLGMDGAVTAADEPQKNGVSQFTPTQIEFFEKKIRPLLAKHCYACHGAKKQEGGLRLDSRPGILKGGESGPAIVAGKPEKSELISAVNYEADGYQMPPEGKLKPNEIAALTEWVKLKAPWPDSPEVTQTQSGGMGIDLTERAKHWCFQPIRKVTPPEISASDQLKTPIDNFILKRLHEAKLTPASRADKRTLLRRLTFDLTGMPPTPAEIEAFLKDASPNAYERLVDRLLASPRYGERWGRHWLDLVRYAETAGHEFDYELHHTRPYRDYVVRALNDDTPYNQFVTEHIAGDLLSAPRRNLASHINESIIGTSFYWLGQGKHSPVDIRAEECDRIDNQLDVFGKTFLGLTIACTRCHDHKFDPLTAKDYYALAGYLKSSRLQYADVNPAQANAIPAHRIHDLKTGQAPLLRNVIADTLQSQLKDLFKVDSVHKAAQQPEHIFHSWSILSQQKDQNNFLAQKNNLLKQMHSARSSAQAILKQADVFEDFNGTSYKDWFSAGEAFGDGPTQQADYRLGNRPQKPIRELPAPGIAHSGLISGKLHGALRSKTFTITKPFLFYKIRRREGQPNPGRQNKNGQVHLVIDGFQFIKDPLYGGLTLNIPLSEDFRWYRQILTKFIGMKAYIEILDEDDGFIEVETILASTSGATPATPPNPLVLRILDDPNVDSAEKLGTAFQQLLTKSIHLWKDGGVSTDVAARIEIVNELLRHPQLFSRNSQNPQPEVAAVLNQCRQLESQIARPQKVVAMADGTGENEYLLIRGNHKKQGDPVPRRFLQVFSGEEQPQPEQGSGRLELARKVVDPSNPLTARVIVNRLWQHHFGRGIVSTPDNFGKLGQLPSHPDLLDYLASELVRNDWSLKQIHRLILLSGTYQRTSKPSDAVAEENDPQNLLLHRMRIRRLEGEAIRDAILAISGRLDSKMAGPSVPPYLTAFMEGRGRPKQSGPLDGDGRRSLYINVRRNFLTPMFLAFDYPLPLTTMGRRSISNVPAQALTMMNNPFVVQQTAVWANRMLARPGLSTDDRIGHLYETAFARFPTDAELAAAKQFLNDQGKEYNGPDDPRSWADLCHVLLNVKEFVFLN